MSVRHWGWREAQVHDQPDGLAALIRPGQGQVPDGHEPRPRVPTGRGRTVAARAQGDGDLPMGREAPLPGALPEGRSTVGGVVQDGGHVGEGEVAPLRVAEEQRERIAPARRTPRRSTQNRSCATPPAR